MRRKSNYKFTRKKHSKKGIISCCISAGSMLTLFLVVLASYQKGGEGSVYLGSAGILAFILAVGAIIIGIMSFREEETYRLFPRLSVFLSIAMTLIWTIFYFNGIYLILS
ncbi:MAG: DUF6142 family protein [Lachnospiraceae bacterium]